MIWISIPVSLAETGKTRIKDVIQKIVTREQLVHRLDEGAGYFYNDFGSRNAKDCPIHSISCRWLERMVAVPEGKLSVPKIWANDLTELTEWLRNQDKPFSICSTCGRSSVQDSYSAGHPHKSATARTTFKNHVNFEIVDPVVDNNRVDIWSDKRLQFEGGKDMSQFRRAIRIALGGLKYVPGQLCYGMFRSEDSSACDVENVLFYNVGTGCFRNLMADGVAFERAFGPVPGLSSELEFNPRYYHRYQFTSPSTPWYEWTVAHRIASFETQVENPVLTLARPERVWQAVRRGAITIHTRDTHEGLYGLRIEMLGPRREFANLNTMLKPLLDGVISAFHAHDGDRIDTCSSRVAESLGADVADVSSMLIDSENAVLGTRRCFGHGETAFNGTPRMTSALLLLSGSRMRPIERRQ